MSHNIDDVVLINRSDESTSLARIVAQPVYYVKNGTNAVYKKSENPVGTMVKDEKNNVYIATQVYAVLLLNDDLTHTGKGKIITKSDIVESMMPHFRGVKLLKIKNDLPDDIRMKIDEIEINGMNINADNAPINIKKLKLFMNKYRAYPYFIKKKIKETLKSIILSNYGKYGKFKFHNGAHPEFIMNAFIYNPWESEERFKILRIDGTQVTVALTGLPMTIGLDEFLKTRITAQTPYGWRELPIGEVYGFFPERDLEYDTDDLYNEKLDTYLGHLMTVFAKKPPTDFFSVPHPQQNHKPQEGDAEHGGSHKSRRHAKSRHAKSRHAKSRHAKSRHAKSRHANKTK
jgi:hypothetical protein